MVTAVGVENLDWVSLFGIQWWGCTEKWGINRKRDIISFKGESSFLPFVKYFSMIKSRHDRRVRHHTWGRRKACNIFTGKPKVQRSNEKSHLMLKCILKKWFWDDIECLRLAFVWEISLMSVGNKLLHHISLSRKREFTYSLFWEMQVTKWTAV